MANNKTSLDQPFDGYEFISPKPLSDDGKHFVGLALDDVNQFEETDERLSQWCMQYQRGFYFTQWQSNSMETT